MNKPVIVFDIGGVLVPEGNRMEQLQAFLHERLGSFDASAFTEAYWAHRDAYDLGSTDTQFWQQVFTAAGVAAFTEDDITAAATKDGQLNSTASAQALQLISQLAGAGVHIAILSNAPLAMARAVKDAAWSDPFTALVFSSELQDRKPNDSIYAALDAALKQAGCMPIDLRDIHFFDDRPINIQAADAHGWSAHQWVDTSTAREELTRAGVLK